MAKETHSGLMKLQFICRTLCPRALTLPARGRNQFCKTLNLKNKQKAIHITNKSEVLGKLDVADGSDKLSIFKQLKDASVNSLSYLAAHIVDFPKCMQGDLGSMGVRIYSIMLSMDLALKAGNGLEE